MFMFVDCCKGPMLSGRNFIASNNSYNQLGMSLNVHVITFAHIPIPLENAHLFGS